MITINKEKILIFCFLSKKNSENELQLSTKQSTFIQKLKKRPSTFADSLKESLFPFDIISI